MAFLDNVERSEDLKVLPPPFLLLVHDTREHVSFLPFLGFSSRFSIHEYERSLKARRRGVASDVRFIQCLLITGQPPPTLPPLHSRICRNKSQFQTRKIVDLWRHDRWE